jgi:hypothetical protein
MFLSSFISLCMGDSFCLVLHTRLCHNPHVLYFCVERHTTPCLSMKYFSSALLSTSATFLLYLRYKLAKVHSFITSLIYLEPRLRHNKPLHHA